MGSDALGGQAVPCDVFQRAVVCVRIDSPESGVAEIGHRGLNWNPRSQKSPKTTSLTPAVSVMISVGCRAVCSDSQSRADGRGIRKRRAQGRGAVVERIEVEEA